MFSQCWSSKSSVWRWTYIGPLRLKDIIQTSSQGWMWGHKVNPNGFWSPTQTDVAVFIFCLCSGSFDSAWVIIDGLYSHFIFQWACNGVRISLSDVLLAFYHLFWSPQPTYCSQACLSLKSMHSAMSKITKSGHVYTKLIMFDTAVKEGKTLSLPWMFACTYVDLLTTAVVPLTGWWICFPGWFWCVSWSSAVLVPACPGEFSISYLCNECLRVGNIKTFFSPHS